MAKNNNKQQQAAQSAAAAQAIDNNNNNAQQQAAQGAAVKEQPQGKAAQAAAIKEQRDSITRVSNKVAQEQRSVSAVLRSLYEVAQADDEAAAWIKSVTGQAVGDFFDRREFAQEWLRAVNKYSVYTRDGKAVTLAAVGGGVWQAQPLRASVAAVFTAVCRGWLVKRAPQVIKRGEYFEKVGKGKNEVLRVISKAMAQERIDKADKERKAIAQAAAEARAAKRAAIAAAAQAAADGVAVAE